MFLSIRNFFDARFACVAIVLVAATTLRAQTSEEDAAYQAQMEAMNNSGDPNYGSSSEYGSSGYGQSAGGSASLMNVYAPGISQLGSGFKLTSLFSPGANIEVQTGPALSRESEQAFAAGNQALAFELVCGHMATEYDEARPTINSVQFSDALKRPVWIERWAVSIAIRGSEDVASPDPIRDGATTPGRSVASAGGRGGYNGDEGGGAAFEAEQQTMMEEQYRMEQSYNGPDEGMDPSMAAVKKAPAIKREMLSAEADKVMDDNLGFVAEVIADEFSERFSRGDFGPLFVSITPPAKTDPLAIPIPAPQPPADAAKVIPGGGTMSEELADALAESPDSAPMWRPGLTYLGEGSSNETLLLAKAENVDFLLHFDVLLKPGRDNGTLNVSRCRLFNMATGKQLALTKSIDSTEASQMISTGRAANERAYILDQCASLLGIIDRDTKVVPMPNTLTPDVAKRRVASLMGGPAAKTLRTLAEIRLYQSLGLLTQEEVEMAFDIIGGPDALLLLHGPRDERLAMARKWAVASQLRTKK